MNKWYRSAPCKGILILLLHAAVVAMVVCAIWGLAYPGREYSEALTDVSKERYSETKGFGKKVQDAGREILLDIQMREKVETDGKYDPAKKIDIRTYEEGEAIDSGLIYKLGDLVKLGQTDSEGAEVVVCQKPDGTYFYYEWKSFSGMVKEKQLSFVKSAGYEDYTDSDMLNSIRSYNGNYSDEERTGVQDAEGKLLYKDCWMLAGACSDQVKMADGKTLMQMANENPKWNGKLQEAYQYLERAARSAASDLVYYEEIHDKWTEGNTNLEYLLLDLDQKKVYTNREAYNALDQAQKNLENMAKRGENKEGAYLLVAPKLSQFQSNMTVAASDSREMVSQHLQGKGNYAFGIFVDTKYPIEDSFYTQNQAYEKYMPWIGVILIVGISAAAAFVILMVWLTIIAGRTRKEGELKLVWFDRLKTELGVAVIILLCAALVSVIASMGIYASDIVGAVTGTLGEDTAKLIGYPVLVAVPVAAAFALFLTGYLGLIRRLKAKSLWSNSICKSFCCFFVELFANRSGTFKVIACFIGFILMHWLAVSGGFFIFTAICVDAFGFVCVVKNAMAKQRISKGIKMIAGGDVGYEIPLKGLKGSNLDMAVHVNNIGEGLNAAVEENMKNERLKTDLITNVSHDIKTPLTSIINYVDLLKRENFSDPKVRGYLDVLEAKAQRLKTLTEDVVEASKISSGNIKLELMNINLVEMINQTNGEFQEKLQKRGLQVVLNLPDEPAIVCADGRRMWRVLENIYNNAAKYAMERTRVYADMVVKPRTVEFSLKNISEQPLNITADELTERFIRGDVSRSTEGSGLGLSIAKSLTELQGGQFHLYLDGDLFKVTIIFQRVYHKQEEEHKAQSKKDSSI